MSDDTRKKHLLGANYWSETVPKFQPEKHNIPTQADVVIVGGGYTGLSAAAEIAQTGAKIMVLDAQDIGHGCSSRNGGQVSASIKPSYHDLKRAYGADHAFAIKGLGFEAFRNLKGLVQSEGLEVDWHETGRVLAAHTDGHLAQLRQEMATQVPGLEIPYQVFGTTERHDYIGSSGYVGGVFTPMAAGVNPAKLLRAMALRAQSAGAMLFPNLPLRKLKREGSGFLVSTDQGSIRTTQLLIATNGYTGTEVPWLQRRVIPIVSTMIATQIMDPEQVKQLIPKGRMVIDTRHVVVYFRPSPDGHRILFGGRAGLFHLPEEVAARRLMKMLLRSFPDLGNVGVEHCWSGTVGFTFDKLPHVGCSTGLYYAMGYCGSGVAMSIYLGKKIALQMLGRPEGKTPLDGLSFQSRPYFFGQPWFLAPAVAAMRVADHFPKMAKIMKL